MKHFSQDELRFDYPAAWRYFPISGFTTSFYDVRGYLASTPVDTSRICVTTPSSTSCNARGYDLSPGNIVITVGGGGMPMDPIAFFDHPEQGTRMTVGGMATVFSYEQPSSDHILLTWKIERPRAFGNWVQLDADILGPGQDQRRAEVEALIASLHFDPPPAPISTDPAVARSIATKAMSALQAQGPGYDCFPDQAGSSATATVTEVPNMPSLRKPLVVTCSVAIAPTDIGFWKLDLTMRWTAASDRSAGEMSWTEWLPSDGSLGAQSGTGAPPDGYL